MSKNTQKKKHPRYLTIRIQYYPIPKRFFAVLFLLFFSFFVSHFNWWIEPSVISYPKKEIAEYPFIPFSTNESSLAQSAQVIFHGDRTKKQVALTFDADMTPQMKSLVDQGQVANYYDQEVIDILKLTQTKATLFLSGMWIEMYKNDAKSLAANPLFELASHSYSHPSFDGECYGLGEIADNQTQEEIQKTQDLLKELTGVTNTLFRFPGGCYSQQDVDIATKNGLKVIQWDAAGQDGFNTDISAIENNILQNIQNGSIIVLHMHGGPNAPKTADALPKIISRLKEQRYQFVTVTELLEKNQTEQAFDIKQVLSYVR